MLLHLGCELLYFLCGLVKACLDSYFTLLFVPKQLSNVTEYWTHTNNRCCIRFLLLLLLVPHWLLPPSTPPWTVLAPEGFSILFYSMPCSRASALPPQLDSVWHEDVPFQGGAACMLCFQFHYVAGYVCPTS